MRFTKKKSSILTIVLGPLMLVFSFYFFTKKVWPDYTAAKQSMSWPTVQGEIKNSYLDTRESGTGRKKKITYRANISYEYTVSGKTYRNGDIYIGSSSVFGSKSGAKNTLSRYPVGQKVKVYHSKTSPAKAALQPGAKPAHYVWIGSTAIFAVLGLVFTLTILFKMTVFTAVAGSIVGGLFRKERKEQVGRRPYSGHEAINLDDEMLELNQISASSVAAAPEEAPWNHKWIIKSSKSDKTYGPYEYKHVLRFLSEGKIRGAHKCCPEGGGAEVRVDYIASKRQSKAA